MLPTPTLDKLHALKLPALAQAWTEQQQNAELAALGFDERLGLLVEAEWLARENKRLARALQEAKLKLPQACLEAIDYPARRELDKAVIRQLATCRWIDEHQQVLVTGATGTGKSFIACALAHQACRRGYRAYYVEAAWAAIRTKDSALGARYRRVMRHRGHKKAVVAVAHAMLRVVYHLLAEGTPYREPGADYDDRRHAERVTRRAIQLLERQGYRVILERAA
jgi:hypothetical protein